MLKSYQDTLISGLVKRGYTVGPASTDLSLSNSGDNQPSYLLAFTIFKAGREVFAKDIYEDILAIFAESKAYYYSLVVAHSYDATWVGCNFSFPEKKVPPPVPKLPPNKGNLN
jgi:hypothetical protein